VSAALSLGLFAFVAGLLLTLAAERVACAAGVVARPKSDRWHRREVPLLGGVAIALATLGPMLTVARGDARLLVLAVASLVIVLVGVVDDLRALSPQAKLLAQIVLAAVLVNFGFVLNATGYRALDVFVTIVWVVGITNAFNLLDNMDGLSATIALVAAGFRLLFFHWEGEAVAMTVCAIFMGALAGFLVRNFAPAKIFMGDAGSLFLGFFLAELSLTETYRAYSRGVAAVLVIPVLLLLIPIFDTSFVTATRLLSGRSPAVGGRDHTSHRLVAVGLSERQTVTVLALVSACAGGVAVLWYRVGFSQTVVLLALLVIALVLLAVYLSRVHVVQAAQAGEAGAVLQLLSDFHYKRQVATLLLDVCLICVAYYAAYLLRYEEAFLTQMRPLQSSLPVVLLFQILALAAFGLYRGIWEYTGVSDVLRIVKAVSVGTAGVILVLVWSERFVGFSWSVFVLDWLLLVVLLGATRASFRFFEEMFRPRPASFQRVVIYGAGDGGELLLRELRNNPALERVAIGFIDDDRGKHRTRIHGLPVFGSSERVEDLIRERGVTEVIVSSDKIRGPALEHTAMVCERFGVPVRRGAFRLE
jgi:UDP-GlcNAc:undecaprenyl-phosphate GlcNAc-1-phosphate transferase